jgi:nucleotide-binding universal stress UspA family protein
MRDKTGFMISVERAMKVLLAIDGSEVSEAAVNEVLQRQWPAGSQLRVFSVVDMIGFPMPETDEYSLWEDESFKLAEAKVERAASRIRSAQTEKVEVTTLVVKGHAKHEILEEAERFAADLIVLGSHGFRGLTRFLLGSVSQAVAAHAKCSVEIVRLAVKSAGQDS